MLLVIARDLDDAERWLVSQGLYEELWMFVSEARYLVGWPGDVEIVMVRDHQKHDLESTVTMLERRGKAAVRREE